MSVPDDSEVKLDQVIKKSETGLVFYRKCYVDGKTYNVGHNILIRDEGRYKLAYLLKIYCRTKGNERALVRWFFTDADFPRSDPEQHYPHEIFATSYTGKVAVSTIRKLLHVIWVSTNDEIPETVPKDVYYVYRYFDHDKQALVQHRSQLLHIRYMPKPVPDSVGSSLSIKDSETTSSKTPDIKFSLPYIEDGTTFYKVCCVGKDKYKIGDCVLLVNRDGSSIRRIISFSYNHEERPIAFGQFIYYQNEVTLTPEQRALLHYQEVLVSNWKRELLISNVKKKIIVIHQNIFQPVPDNALKAVYFLKRYYDPFKKKIFPLSEPLTRSDFSIVPAPIEDCLHTPKLSEIVRKDNNIVYYRSCQISESVFGTGDFITMQSGSVCVRVISLYEDADNNPVMDVNKLFTIRNIPSSDRHLLSTGLLFSNEVYHNVSCTLFFERICVVFHPDDIANEQTYVAGDFFDAEAKELYRLKKPAKTLGMEDVPEPGSLLRDMCETEESSEESTEESQNDEESSSSETEEEEGEEDLNKSKSKKRKIDHPPLAGNHNKDKTTGESKRGKKQLKKEERSRKKLEKDKLSERQKEEKLKKFQQFQKKEKELISQLLKRDTVLGDEIKANEFSWVKVVDVTARVGDVVFVKLVEGIQLGRIVSIYRDSEDVLRLKMFRFYLEEEMFVSKRESTTIHINECFATDFIIYALVCQLEEIVDIVYLKKKEKIPPQEEIPKGRLFVRRYYHPTRHLLRSLAEPLEADDLTVIPAAHPPVTTVKEESKALNTAPQHPTKNKEAAKSGSPKKKKSNDVELSQKSKPHKSLSVDIKDFAGKSSDGKAHIQKESSPKNTSSGNRGKDVPELSKSNTSISCINVTTLNDSQPNIPDITAPTHHKVLQDSQRSSEQSEFKPAEMVFNKISIISESEVGDKTMTILPENMISISVGEASHDPAPPPTIQIIQQEAALQTIQIVQENHPITGCNSNVLQIVPNRTNKPSSHSLEIIPSKDEPNTIEIVPSNQIQIVSGDSTEIQVISSENTIQILPTLEQTTSSSSTSQPFVPTIISSEQELDSEMDIDISHAEDGCITIAPVATKRNTTAKFEDSYTKDGRVYFRKCHFKNEKIVQGDTVYVRCGNDENLSAGEESWKLGRVLEFYHSKVPVVRLLWFYVVEEMVTSKTERSTIHPQEVFASQCDDQIEISSIESKAAIVFLKEKESIPKDSAEKSPSVLYCRRFYDPYKHSIKSLKTRLSAEDPTILPEPAVKRKSKGVSTTPQEKKKKTAVKRKIIETSSKSNKRSASLDNCVKSSLVTPEKIIENCQVVVNYHPLVEDCPTVDNRPTVEDCLNVEDILNVKDQHAAVIEARPSAEDQPVVQTSPVVQESITSVNLEASSNSKSNNNGPGQIIEASKTPDLVQIGKTGLVGELPSASVAPQISAVQEDNVQEDNVQEDNVQEDNVPLTEVPTAPNEESAKSDPSLQTVPSLETNVALHTSPLNINAAEDGFSDDLPTFDILDDKIGQQSAHQPPSSDYVSEAVRTVVSDSPEVDATCQQGDPKSPVRESIMAKVARTLLGK